VTDGNILRFYDILDAMVGTQVTKIIIAKKCGV
jgi:hypothetical protein